jgi:hypothetical protein
MKNNQPRNQMKIKHEKTIGDEIAMQIRGTGTTFTITMTESECGRCESVILKDNLCGDITIIQDYGEGLNVMFLETEHLEGLKRIIL